MSPLAMSRPDATEKPCSSGGDIEDLGLALVTQKVGSRESHLLEGEDGEVGPRERVEPRELELDEREGAELASDLRALIARAHAAAHAKVLREAMAEQLSPVEQEFVLALVGDFTDAEWVAEHEPPRGSFVIDLLRGEVEVVGEPPSDNGDPPEEAPLCRYPGHRASGDWRSRDGRLHCRVCHRPAPGAEVTTTHDNEEAPMTEDDRRDEVAELIARARDEEPPTGEEEAARSSDDEGDEEAEVESEEAAS